jgi:predicted AlkP superfamily phosphohydrolase/phosphomutase
MKPTEMLNQIKNVLGIELSAEEVTQEVIEKVELAQMSLENGTVIEAEEFAPEMEVFIITEEDKIALPIGEYSLEDGRILIVEEDGIIKEIKSAEAEGEEAPEVEIEVEAAEEEEKEEMGYVKKEEFAAAVEEIKAMIDELKAGMKEKEEMEEQVREELSATPASAPLKHNPEAEAQKEAFNYSTKRAESTRDRVFAKLANLK